MSGKGWVVSILSLSSYFFPSYLLCDNFFQINITRIELQQEFNSSLFEIFDIWSEIISCPRKSEYKKLSIFSKFKCPFTILIGQWNITYHQRCSNFTQIVCIIYIYNVSIEYVLQFYLIYIFYVRTTVLRSMKHRMLSISISISSVAPIWIPQPTPIIYICIPCARFPCLTTNYH